ncbi:hypothetical protein ACQKM2_28170 [Streptomyces sp. NPDC004126]|uniref:hypothetical protein n=1 Tax=Streptomyces sp. NPDC004126 TaxID=3390695 RepID=UPI003D075822
MSGFKVNRRAIEQLQKEIAKEFERANRKHPVRVPIELDVPDLGGLLLSSTSGLESEPHLSRLLIWLHESVRPRPGGFADIRTFLQTEHLPEDEADNMALKLEKLGLVRIARSLAGGLSEVYPTDDGLLEARRLLELRRDPIARFSHACDRLLRGVLRAGGAAGTVDVTGFANDPACSFAGEPLTEEEIVRVMDYLCENGLVRLRSSEDCTTAQTTATGTRCVLAGGTVHDYLNRTQPSGDTYNITNSHGFVAGSQHHVTQNNNFGLDASKLTEFAQMVRQFSPSLGTSDEERDQLLLDAEVLEETTTADRPEPSRIRAAYQRVHEALTAIGAATPGLTLLIETGQNAYRATFGA